MDTGFYVKTISSFVLARNIDSNSQQHGDPTDYDFYNPLVIVPWNQGVRSSCSCSLLGQCGSVRLSRAMTPEASAGHCESSKEPLELVGHELLVH